MSHEFKLSSDFPFAAHGPNQFSYLGACDLHVKVEAATHAIAREVGNGIMDAMEIGSCPAAQAAIIHYVNEANQKQQPLACTLSL